MRLHDRYLFRELITPLAFCLGAFVIFGIFVFFLTDLTKLQEHKLNFFESVAYCAANLPASFVLVLPILLLLAMLYALTSHARYNEITALRAAGVSLWRVCAPYFAAGLLATGIYFVINELAVPICDQWADQILNRHVIKDSSPKSTAHSVKGFSNDRAHRFWHFAGYDEQTTLMLNPTVEWSLPDGSWRAVLADHAIRTNGVWTFFGSGTNSGVQLFRQSGPGGDLVKAGTTNVLAMPEFDETPERIRLLLKYADAQALHASGYADIPLAELWELMQNQPNLRPEDASAVQTKFHGRLASPWTCFVVVLIAIPFGAPSGRRNLFFGVAGSLFIGFAYFILQKISLALGINGYLPGWLAAWLPNLVFAITGIVLTLRVR